VREHDQLVADGDFDEADVGELTVVSAMGHRRHASRQGVEYRGGAAYREGLKGLAPREHEDDQGPGQVFAEHDGGHDGNARQDVGAEFAPK
jgi:hypothetical protein